MKKYALLCCLAIIAVTQFAQAKDAADEIVANALALVGDAKADQKQVDEIARRYGFYLGENNQNLFTLYSEGKRDRAELEKIAENIKKEYQKQRIVKETGLLSFDGSKDNPVLIPLEVIVEFDKKLSEEDIKKLNNELAVNVKRDPLKFTPNQYIVSIPAGREGVMELIRRYSETGLVDYAHPNYWKVDIPFETTPFDPLYAEQWHHRNTGQLGGLVDADADTSFAWDYGMGSNNIVVAVFDDGSDTGHEDLAPNLFVNPGEVPGNSIDDDGNGFVDDVSGWDFADSDNDPSAQGTESHGTAVSGVAVARGNNSLGVTGACPQCSWMPLRRDYGGFPDSGRIAAFNYVATMNVDIMNNSWGATSPSSSVSPAVATAINNAQAAGVIIFFAGGNANTSGWCAASYPSLNSVIAVSSSTNLDIKVTESAWGNCIDILAPSHRGYNRPFNGTKNITTTDRTGNAGYNSTSPPSFCSEADPADTDYTHCFGGTSSASPFTAGIAGLILSADNSLTPNQVENLIQDTADKIVPGTASYDGDTAFSTSHSYGRINAWEAVRTVSAVGDGKNGTDIFVRDNVLDWGNTTGYEGQQNSKVKFESPRESMAHWVSEDIKVDAPPYQTPPTAATFDAFIDEKPSLAAGEVNRAYVRIRNRGHVAAENVDVKLMWTQFGTALPALNADFWTQFPNDSSLASNPWTSMVCEGSSQAWCDVDEVPYSGASVAGSPSDSAVIARFDFDAPAYDPSLANHFCLLAVTNAENDPVHPISTGIFLADSITPNDNNVTHRNYHNLDTSEAEEGSFTFFIRNPSERVITTWLDLDMSKELHELLELKTDGFDWQKAFRMKPGEERLVALHIHARSEKALGLVNVIQKSKGKNGETVLGGLSIEIKNAKIQNSNKK